MPTPRIPTGFKPVAAGYQIGSPDGVSLSEVAGGMPRVGLYWARGKQVIQVGQVLSQTKFYAWTLWFQRVIGNGSMQFLMPLDTGMGLQDHLCTMVAGSYSAAPLAGARHWSVSFSVIAESSAYGLADEDITAYFLAWEAVGGSPSMDLLLARLARFATVETTSALAPAPAPAPAPGPAPAPSPSPPTIAIADEPTYILEHGDYFEHENVWGATGLTRGVYTGLGGTTYESQSGVLYPADGHGPVAARWKWAFPTGTTEVKSYPSEIAGNMPGWYNTSAAPGGIPIRLQNGTTKATTPSGKTPNSIFPIALPVAGILTSHFAYALNSTPTGLWHLAYDIWVQDSPTQVNGFTVPPITHELMIVCTYGGGYGSYPGRNPAWYWGDATVDGILWHIYYAPGFNGAWQFIVFEPDTPTSVPATGHRFNIAAFLNFAHARGWIAAPNPITGNPGTHVVSVQLGVETVEGTGDLTMYDFDVKDT